MKTRDELSAREVEALHESLLHRLGDSSVPTLPHVAMRVLELVSDRNATFKHFADVIQTDQALSGRLLRMANSAAFAQCSPVTKIERAAILLGMDRLKALALGFHLSKAASSAEGAGAHKRVWTYSLFRAWLACRVAEYIDASLSGEAFIVGLMSDAGVPMMPLLAGDRYAQVISDAAPPHEQFSCEFRLLPFTHVDVAAAMCRLWKLPQILLRPIARHHEPPAPPARGDAHGLLHAVAYFVAGIPFNAIEGAAPPASCREMARQLFRIKPEDLRTLIQAAGRDLDSCKDVFQHILDETVSVDAIMEVANQHLVDSVENLVAESLTHEQAPVRRITTSSLMLEATRTAPNQVRVYINSPSGAPILSEEFETSGRSDADIAGILMLGELPPDEARRVISVIRNLAA